MSLPAENIRPTEIAQPSNALTPMDMLQRAVDRGADLDMIEKLMDLQERWERTQSRKQFEQALAAAKAEIKPIARNKEGHNKKKYADIAAVADAIDTILSKNGLQYRFATGQTEKLITVTCVVFGYGHNTETPLSGPADMTGNKNAIQAIGSTLTYLQRYSLMMALGLAAGNDDDGKSSQAGGEAIDQDQVAELIALADEVGADKARFCKHFKVDSFAAIPAARYQAAVDALNSKRRA